MHLAPLGGKELNALVGGAFRVDYLVHILLFLPWMFLARFRLYRRTRGNIEMQNDTGERLQTERNADLKSDGTKTNQASWRLEKVEIVWQWGLIWMVMGIGLAVAAEGLQHWLPLRSFNPMDVIFNVLGVMLGAMALGGWYAIRPGGILAQNDNK